MNFSSASMRPTMAASPPSSTRVFLRERQPLHASIDSERTALRETRELASRCADADPEPPPDVRTVLTDRIRTLLQDHPSVRSCRPSLKKCVQPTRDWSLRKLAQTHGAYAAMLKLMQMGKPIGSARSVAYGPVATPWVGHPQPSEVAPMRLSHAESIAIPNLPTGMAFCISLRDKAIAVVDVEPSTDLRPQAVQRAREFIKRTDLPLATMHLVLCLRPRVIALQDQRRSLLATADGSAPSEERVQAFVAACESAFPNSAAAIRNAASGEGTAAGRTAQVLLQICDVEPKAILAQAKEMGIALIKMPVGTFQFDIQCTLVRVSAEKNAI